MILKIFISFVIIAVLSGCAVGPCGPTFYNPFNKSEKAMTSTPTSRGGTARNADSKVQTASSLVR